CNSLYLKLKRMILIYNIFSIIIKPCFKCYNVFMEKVIEVENLKKTYALAKGGTLEAIKGTSFFVEKGEIFGILGPNGAGKTTTLEIIEGLKAQTSGSVTVLGFDNLKNPDDIKKLIGIQLQSSQYLYHLSLGELLDLFASFYG